MTVMIMNGVVELVVFMIVLIVCFHEYSLLLDFVE